MATSVQEAAANFRAVALPFRAMLDLCDVLTDLGPLEQHIHEVEERNAAAVGVEAELKAAKIELVEVQAKLDASYTELLEHAVTMAEGRKEIADARQKLRDLFA